VHFENIWKIKPVGSPAVVGLPAQEWLVRLVGPGYVSAQQHSAASLFPFDLFESFQLSSNLQKFVENSNKF
jgi:hypothetical protein